MTSPKETVNAWSLAAGGARLAVSALLGTYVGYRLDIRWGTAPWLLVAGALLGAAAGMYGFLRPFFVEKR